MIKIPDNLKGKELFDFLRTNKKRLIAEKTFKKRDKVCDQVFSESIAKSIKATKAVQEVVELTPGSVPVTLIGNTFNWCDSQMDVLFPSCANKTIKELGPKGKDLIYHLKNHDTDVDDRIGYITDIYEQTIALKDLGLDMVGSTVCLLFDSEVRESLCKSSYNQYLDKKVKQHSIGLRYVKIILCINDSNDAEHFKNWNQYYQFILNKPAVDSVGYFWAVTEIKLYEVSFVLWGANELSGVIEDNEDKSEPPLSTHKEEEPDPFTHEEEKQEVKASVEKSILFYL